jgi:hypothetical protein
MIRKQVRVPGFEQYLCSTGTLTQGAPDRHRSERGRFTLLSAGVMSCAAKAATLDTRFATRQMPAGLAVVRNA